MLLPRTASAELGKPSSEQPRKGRGGLRQAEQRQAQELRGGTAGRKAELSTLCPTPPAPQPILLSVSFSENRPTPGNTSEKPLVPTSIPLLYPQGSILSTDHLPSCSVVTSIP